MKARWFILILAASVLITFAPSLKNAFVLWDEDRYLITNVSIQDFSPSGFAHLFDPHIKIYDSLGSYFPLTLLTFDFEYHFFALNPLIYHLDNLILHLLNVLLVFWLIYLLSSKIVIAFLTALLFGISPLRVDSVAWVMERKDVLFSFFYLSSLIAYIIFIKNRLSKFLVLSLGLFWAALLAKLQALSLPMALFLIDYYKNRPWTKSLILEKLPYLAIGIGVFIYSLSDASQIPLIHQDSTIVLACYIEVMYFVKSFIPYHLSCLDSVPKLIHGFLPWEVYASVIIILSWAWLIFKRYTVNRNMIFGLLFFLLLMVLPILNMRIAHEQSMHFTRLLFYEHYTYLPSIGLYLLFAQKYVKWLEAENSKNFKRGMVFLMGAYLLIMAWVSFERCAVWKNNLTLWTDTIQHQPLAFVYINRGNAYNMQGKMKEALSDYNKAIEISPNYPEAYVDRGVTYAEIGMIQQAISDFNKAITIDPDFANAYYNRALTYARLGQKIQANLDWEKFKLLKTSGRH